GSPRARRNCIRGCSGIAARSLRPTCSILALSAATSAFLRCRRRLCARLTSSVSALEAAGPGGFRGADARKRRTRSDERRKQRCNEPERTHLLPSRREPYDRGSRLASGHLLQPRTLKPVLGHASLSTSAIFAHVQASACDGHAEP